MKFPLSTEVFNGQFIYDLTKIFSSLGLKITRIDRFDSGAYAEIEDEDLYALAILRGDLPRFLIDEYEDVKSHLDQYTWLKQKKNEISP